MHPDKHESFWQVDFNTLGIKVSYKVILSLLMGMFKHSQNTQSNNFTISLQYLKKWVRDEVHFMHAGKHQSFYKLALSFLMEVTRHVQSRQNRKLVIFLQYLKKKILMNFFLHIDNYKSFLQIDTNILGLLDQTKSRYPQFFR